MFINGEKLTGRRVATASVVWLAMSIGAARTQAQIPCGYEVAHVIQAPYCEPFGYPPTAGIGISPNGRYVCGFYLACVVGQPRAFVFDTTTELFTTLPHPPGITSSQARGVTDAGVICGTAIKSGVGDQGFVYDSNTGVWTPLPSQAGTSGWSRASAINSSNVVCGFRSLDNGGDPVDPWIGYVWTARAGFMDMGLINGQTTEARDINELSIVTGTMAVGNQNHGFIFIDGKHVDLGTLAGIETVPSAISNLNQVVGRSRVPLAGAPFGVNHAFFWSKGVMNDVGTLPSHNLSFGNDLNDQSMVVGSSRTLNQNNDRGFVWRDGAMRDINEFFFEPALDVLDSCNSISAGGTIVATGTLKSNPYVTVVLSPQPNILGDVNHTCSVNVDDLLIIVNEWGQSESVADINADKIVNYLDLLIVIENWTFD